METLEDIKWVDTHCHLQLMGDEINEKDITNLEYFIIPGVDVPSSLKAKEFSLTYPEKSYWSAGLHPHEADSLEDIKNELKVLMEEADLIGETGLDYYRNLSSKENQIINFEFHIDVSKELNKPLIVHCRDSFADVFDTLSSKNTTNPIILHSWTGGNKWTKKFETIYRGTISSLKNQISETLKGEITIVVGPSKNDKKIDLDIDAAVKILLNQGVQKREIAKTLALVTDLSVNELYENIKGL